ncbi:hypothetical protein N431DRAFT_536070 [Stipitochalara longipes BDJ]|nr:hypothetical protein N431DRAFT_536070 [Stipitochalara longipes BDJ]
MWDLKDISEPMTWHRNAASDDGYPRGPGHTLSQSTNTWIKSTRIPSACQGSAVLWDAAQPPPFQQARAELASAEEGFLFGNSPFEHIMLFVGDIDDNFPKSNDSPDLKYKIDDKQRSKPHWPTDLGNVGTPPVERTPGDPAGRMCPRALASSWISGAFPGLSCP